MKLIKHKIILALISLVALVGCGMPGDPMIGDIYASNIWVTGVWDDIRTPVTSIKVGGSRPAIETIYKGSLVLGFEDKILLQQQNCYFTIQIPHGYKEGTDIEAHIHWTPEDNTGGDVVWVLTYSWANKYGTFPVETPLTAIAPAGVVTDEHLRTGFGYISGTGKTISSILLCSLERNSGNILDTYNGKTAYLLEVDFHYQIDSLGSINENTK